MLLTTDQPIIKTRGYAACLTAAFELLKSNWKAFFRATWPYVLILSLATAALFFFTITLTRSAGLVGFAASQAIAICVFLLIACLVHFLFYGSLYRLFNGKSLGYNALRLLKVDVVSMAIVLLLLIVPSSLAYLKHPVIGMLLYYLLCILFVLPLTYSQMKYFMEPDATLRETFTKNFATGFKNIGYILIVLLVYVLLALTISIIISIPMMIVTTASSVSLLGMTQFGDKANLPVFFPAMAFVVTALTVFVITYVNVYAVSLNAHIYGHIESKLQNTNPQD